MGKKKRNWLLITPCWQTSEWSLKMLIAISNSNITPSRLCYQQWPPSNNFQKPVWLIVIFCLNYGKPCLFTIGLAYIIINNIFILFTTNGAKYQFKNNKKNRSWKPISFVPVDVSRINSEECLIFSCMMLPHKVCT